MVSNVDVAARTARALTDATADLTLAALRTPGQLELDFVA